MTIADVVVLEVSSIRKRMRVVTAIIRINIGAVSSKPIWLPIQIACLVT